MVESEKIKKAYPDYKKTVCVDFDGTICKWAFPEEGALQEGVKTALQFFKAMGFKLIISSCRTNKKLNPKVYKQQVRIIRDYLDKHEILFDEIDDGEQGKVVADYYIDDRAIRFTEKKGWLGVISEFVNEIQKDE